MQDEYLTKSEISKLLKVSEPTIDRWRKGGMPSIKTKRKILFRKADVDNWLDKKSQN